MVVSTLLLNGLSSCAGVLSSSDESAQSYRQQFKPSSLVGASPAEVEQAAISYTKANFSILSDGNTDAAIQVLLSRPVTKGELPELGLPKIDFAAQDPPLMLVILRGEFDISNLPARLPASNRHSQVSYLAYVMDLKAGVPTLITGSPQGRAFKRFLNDI